MPKVSLDELERVSEESNFEKVRSKKSKSSSKEDKTKKSHREKKIDYWDYESKDD